MILSASALGARSLPLGLTTAAPEEASLPSLWGCSLCSSCGASANGFCSIDSGRWKCVICSQWTALESDKTREFGFSAFEVTTNADAPGLKPRPNHHSIFVVDENLSSLDLVRLRDALNDALSVAPEDSYLGLILFGSSVRVFELGTLGDRIACDIFNGSTSPSSDDVRELVTKDTAEHKSFVAPLHVAAGSLFKILTFLSDQSTSVKRKTPQRCFGPAIEYAISLAKASDAPSCSVVAVTDSHPSLGPGNWKLIPDGASADSRQMAEKHRDVSRQYYNNMRMLALENRVSIDIFCSGSSFDFGVSALKELTRSIHMRSADCSSSLALIVQGKSSRDRILDIKVSDTKRLIPVHVSGAEDDSRSLLSFTTHGASTVFFEDNGTKRQQSDDVYVQVTSRTVGTSKRLVATYRLSSLRPFTVLDGDALAVVVAKRACIIFETSGGNFEMARKHVENEVYNVSKLLQDETLDAGQFDKFARSLFHFHRGPILDGRGSQYSSDDANALVSTFLYNADNAQALLMMCPALIMTRWGRTSSTIPVFKPAALSTLSLQSDCCLVLDQLTDIFVWFGSDVPKDARERVEALNQAKILSISLSRFPHSKITSFDETSPKAKYIRTRLSPEHMDMLNMSKADDLSRRLGIKLALQPRGDPTYNDFLKLCLGNAIPVAEGGAAGALRLEV